MAAIDFFCSADDRHRVILLVDLLEKTGQRVNLRCDPFGDSFGEPSGKAGPGVPDACLVACTRRALREPWIEALFTCGAQVVAIRLDDAPLPGPCARSIDMRAWPARSADRGVGRLVHWLRYGDEQASGTSGGYRDGAGTAAGTAVGIAAGSDPSAGAGPVAAAGAAAVRRRRYRRTDADKLGGVLLLGVLLAGGVVLSMLVDRQTANGRSESPQHGPARLPSASSAPVPPPPSAPVSTPSSAAEPSPDASLPARPVRDGIPVRHRCLTAAPEAAEAWAGVLSWKLRRRALEEVCMADAERRPAFERLARAPARPVPSRRANAIISDRELS